MITIQSGAFGSAPLIVMGEAAASDPAPSTRPRSCVAEQNGEQQKQQERLKQHLIELDKELEAESIRHEKERVQMLSRIAQLEEQLAVDRNGAAAESTEDLRDQLEHASTELDRLLEAS